MSYDPITSLQAVGYVEREATFLYLVAVHSGYFLRRQYHHFTRRESGAMFARLLQKALRHRYVRVIECTQGRHIYHLASKPVYEAFGCPDSQNRRIKGDAHIKSRLMVLDFVLDHLGSHMLADESGKVEFFTTQCGVPAEKLPRSYMGRLMYFPDGFPILVSDAGAPQFTFFDEGQATATRFERYLRQYQPLFAALGEFELTFIADNDGNSARAKDAFQHFLPTKRLRGVTPMTPLGVDHFLDYLVIKERSESKGGNLVLGDLSVLSEGDSIYTSLEHRALYAAWKMQTTTAEKIRQRFLQTSLRVTFTTVVLPYRYPVYTLRQDALSDESTETPYQTPDDTPDAAA